MGGSGHDMMGSPQAVFTSFKLPKPGSADMLLPPMPTSPFARFPAMPFPATTTTPSLTTPRVLTAPLGGLPAVESQVAARQQQHNHHQQQQPPPSRHLSSPDRNSEPVSPAKRQRLSETEPQNDSPPKVQGLIKAKGTYYPLTAFPTSMPQGPVMHRDGSPPRTEIQPSTFKQTLT
jgi:hypothetical protein